MGKSIISGALLGGVMSSAATSVEDELAEEAPRARRRHKPLSASRPAGQMAEEEDLIEKHFPLVKTVVRRMAMSLPSHLDLDDLHSSGLIGLLNAIRQFDPEAGSSFEGYARVRIRGAILDELRRLDWVPRSIHEKARKVQKTLQQLEQRHSRSPSDAEMAAALNLSPAQFDLLIEEIRPATFVCLDRTVPDEEVELHDTIADPGQEDPVEHTARRELTDLIAARLQQLPEMQRKVLALYYDEGLRLREIAELYGLTESRICQVHVQAILALKSSLQIRECLSTNGH